MQFIMKEQPQVECRSEYIYAERPKAFYWNGDRIVVSDIVARWRTPQALFFRVNTATHGIFDLSYDEMEGIWEIQQP